MIYLLSSFSKLLSNYYNTTTISEKKICTHASTWVEPIGDFSWLKVSWWGGNHSHCYLMSLLCTSSCVWEERRWKRLGIDVVRKTAWDGKVKGTEKWDEGAKVTDSPSELCWIGLVQPTLNHFWGNVWLKSHTISIVNLLKLIPFNFKKALWSLKISFLYFRIQKLWHLKSGKVIS